GETERTTAHLVTALDRGWSELVRIHGTELAKLAAESHRRAIERIAEIAAEEKIDCDCTRLSGYLAGGGDERAIADELEAAHAAGLADVERLDRVPGIELEGPCLHYPRQAQFHPLRYLDGLYAAILARGGRIYGSARVTGIEGDGPFWVEV